MLLDHEQNPDINAYTFNEWTINANLKIIDAAVILKMLSQNHKQYMHTLSGPTD